MKGKRACRFYLFLWAATKIWWIQSICWRAGEKRIYDDRQREDADIIVVNTCCFIHDAKEESVDTILEMAEFRRSGRCRALIIAGCMAERYRQEILDEIPEVDAVIERTVSMP